jgi:hypothetical protein
MAKRHHLDPPPLAVDEEIRQLGEETPPGAEQIRRPGAGESHHCPECSLELGLQPVNVDGPESRGEGAGLSHLPFGLRMEPEFFPLLSFARHATESA